MSMSITDRYKSQSNNVINYTWPKTPSYKNPISAIRVSHGNWPTWCFKLKSGEMTDTESGDYGFKDINLEGITYLVIKYNISSSSAQSIDLHN